MRLIADLLEAERSTRNVMFVRSEDLTLGSVLSDVFRDQFSQTKDSTIKLEELVKESEVDVEEA